MTTLITSVNDMVGKTISRVRFRSLEDSEDLYTILNFSDKTYCVIHSEMVYELRNSRYARIHFMNGDTCGLGAELLREWGIVTEEEDVEMEHVIWKYELPFSDQVTLNLPENAHILSCQMQGRILCLWVVVNPANEAVERTFRVIGTGHAFDFDSQDLEYITTVQDGALVWHIFELKLGRSRNEKQ